MTFHCQICERAIKAKTGLIAHHGYRQPYRFQGDGWRTGSCFGARRLPYEQGHDAIDEYLVNIGIWIGRDKTTMAEMISSPIAVYLYQRKDVWGNKVGPEQSFPKPDDFDPVACLARAYYNIRCYESMWRERYKERERNVVALEAEMTRLTARVAAWKELEPAI